MQSQLTCRNNGHFMHAHYTARQILQGSRWMFSASELTLYYHIQWPKTFRSPIYAYCNHCNASQPAGAMTILCMLTILLGKHCRGHTECSRVRTELYTTTFNDRTHSGIKFMHTIVTGMGSTTYAETSADAYGMGTSICAETFADPYSTCSITCAETSAEPYSMGKHYMCRNIGCPIQYVY